MDLFQNIVHVLLRKKKDFFCEDNSLYGNQVYNKK